MTLVRTAATMVSLFTMTFVCATALAQCPNVCIWDNDHPVGCDFGGSPQVLCTYDASTCYFNTCHGGALKCEPEFKLATEKLLPRSFTHRANDDATSVYLQYVPLLDAPIRLSEVGIGGPKNLLREADVYNLGTENVRSIRLGWIITGGGRKPGRVNRSNQRVLPWILRPGEQIHIAQDGLVANATPGSHILLFIAEVEYSSGRMWRADVKRVTEQIKRSQVQGASAGRI